MLEGLSEILQIKRASSTRWSTVKDTLVFLTYTSANVGSPTYTMRRHLVKLYDVIATMAPDRSTGHAGALKAVQEAIKRRVVTSRLLAD